MFHFRPSPLRFTPGPSAVIILSLCAVATIAQMACAADLSSQDQARTSGVASDDDKKEPLSWIKRLRDAKLAEVTIDVRQDWFQPGGDAPFETNRAVVKTIMTPDAAYVRVWPSTGKTPESTAAPDTTASPAFELTMDGEQVLERAGQPQESVVCYSAREELLTYYNTTSEAEREKIWAEYELSVPAQKLIPIELGCMFATLACGTMLGEQSTLLDWFEQSILDGEVSRNDEGDGTIIRYHIHTFEFKNGELVARENVKESEDFRVVTTSQITWRFDPPSGDLERAVDTLRSESGKGGGQEASPDKTQEKN